MAGDMAQRTKLAAVTRWRGRRARRGLPDTPPRPAPNPLKFPRASNDRFPMAGLTIRGRDPLGVELTIRVGGDGSIIADTPDSAFPPNNLVVGALPDALVPDTAGDSECRLRGRRPT